MSMATQFDDTTIPTSSSSNYNIDNVSYFNDLFGDSDINYAEFISILLDEARVDTDIYSFLSTLLDIDNLDIDHLYHDIFYDVSYYSNELVCILSNLVEISENEYDDIEDDLDDTDLLNIEPDQFIYSEIGIVTGISDNIVNIVGLFDVAFGEMIEILTGSESAMGMVLNIEDSSISAIIFSSDINIIPGQDVVRTSVLMSVPIGDNLLGRIVDPLGNPLDSLGMIVPTGYRFMDSIAPSIISRKSVNTPLETGLKLLIVWFLLDMANVN